ncbi:MAG: hypothetical protein V3U82_09085 [Robiginitomaculum sp.]
MRSIADLESFMDAPQTGIAPSDVAASYLLAGEEILEHWVIAHNGEPTDKLKEGFRILALQRQGAKGDPSFNACRETCRELVYHYNLITQTGDAMSETELTSALQMARLVANHLVLFIGGKLQVAGLGEFCCSSKSLRLKDENILKGESHA